MNISHRNPRRLATLLCCISLVFSSSFSAAEETMTVQCEQQMSCCSSKTVVPCVNTQCCERPVPGHLPVPLDQWKPAGNADLKDFMAATGCNYVGADEVAPRSHAIVATSSFPSQSLIVQHVRLQI
jgi:hypothetical protein